MINKGLRSGNPLNFKKPEADPPAPTRAPSQQSVAPENVVAPSPPAIKSEASRPQTPGNEQTPTTGTSSRRFDLKLRVDVDVLTEFKTQIAPLPPGLRKHVKSYIAKSFAKTIRPGWKSAAVKKGAHGGYRVVLSLPEGLISQILEKHRAYPHEPETMVLSRYLSPKFNEYLKQHNELMS